MIYHIKSHLRKPRLLVCITIAVLFSIPNNYAHAQAQIIAYNKIPGVKPRNVIFILSDDHRYDFMGFTGKVPGLQTPNMDRLAKEG
ncbi:MAG: hypothetical protein WKF91_22345, partial [Segetibacter sp.]